MKILIVLVLLAACIIMDVLFNDSGNVDKWFRGSGGPQKPKGVPENVTSGGGGADDDGVVGEDDHGSDCRERLVVVNSDTCIDCRERIATPLVKTTSAF